MNPSVCSSLRRSIIYHIAKVPTNSSTIVLCIGMWLCVLVWIVHRAKNSAIWREHGKESQRENEKDAKGKRAKRRIELNTIWHTISAHTCIIGIWNTKREQKEEVAANLTTILQKQIKWNNSNKKKKTKHNSATAADDNVERHKKTNTRNEKKKMKQNIK